MTDWSHRLVRRRAAAGMTIDAGKPTADLFDRRLMAGRRSGSGSPGSPRPSHPDPWSRFPIGWAIWERLARAIALVDYHLRRNEVARRSHAKTWRTKHRGVKFLRL
jgi:hypothetical protein